MWNRDIDRGGYAPFCGDKRGNKEIRRVWRVLLVTRDVDGVERESAHVFDTRRDCLCRECSLVVGSRSKIE